VAHQRKRKERTPERAEGVHSLLTAYQRRKVQGTIKKSRENEKKKRGTASREAKT
jgi:hypothetical protein